MQGLRVDFDQRKDPDGRQSAEKEMALPRTLCALQWPFGNTRTSFLQLCLRQSRLEPSVHFGGHQYWPTAHAGWTNPLPHLVGTGCSANKQRPKKEVQWHGHLYLLEFVEGTQPAYLQQCVSVSKGSSGKNQGGHWPKEESTKNLWLERCLVSMFLFATPVTFSPPREASL